MEIDKVIGSIEKYLREFVLYILSFFWSGRDQEEGDLDFDQINRSVVFALLSACMSAYLWNRYVYGKGGAVEDLLGAVLDAMLRWLSLGVLLYGLFRLARVRLHILKPILAVLKTFSVAYIVSIYVAYMARGVAKAFYTTSRYDAESGSDAAMVAYAVNFLLLCIYMPREIFALGPSRTSRWLHLGITAMFLMIVGFINMGRYLVG